MKRLAHGVFSVVAALSAALFIVVALLWVRRRVAVYCYSDVPRPDSQTERLRARADAWRDVSAMDDDAVADAIRADRIDVLVDLAGHLDNRRLLVFARRPAPVQATYVGYSDTTGMRSIGYRITDGFHAPPRENDNTVVNESDKPRAQRSGAPDVRWGGEAADSTVGSAPRTVVSRPGAMVRSADPTQGPAFLCFEPSPGISRSSAGVPGEGAGRGTFHTEHLVRLPGSCWA